MGHPGASKKQTIFTKNFLNSYFLILTLFIISLDQISKYIVIQNLKLGESVPNSGIFRFTHAQNTGTAFSLFQNQSCHFGAAADFNWFCKLYISGKINSLPLIKYWHDMSGAPAV